MRILVIEDNPDLAGNIGDFLILHGHDLDFAANGIQGLELALQNSFDLLILDINLPGMDGFELCRCLRTEHMQQTPVLMLTARGSLADKMIGFEAGAWDYLVKPFALEELKMRIDALQLRQQVDQPRFLRLGDLMLDLSAWCATRDGNPLKLHNAGLRILEALMRAAPNLVSRRDLEYMLWGDDSPDSNPLRSHLHALRKELDKPYTFAMLRTVHGHGYRLVAEEACK